jgi:hypothetical protein
MYDQSPFTVKWLQDDGNVMMFPARLISITPLDLAPGQPDVPRGIQRAPKVMEFDSGDGSGVRHSIDSGIVYVMNQNGKTVDAYHFHLRNEAG